MLRGTVGGLILELVRGEYPVEYREFTLDDAYSAQEAFLTSTTRGVVPIVALDDRAVGSGEVGPIVTDLIGRYSAALDAQR